MIKFSIQLTRHFLKIQVQNPDDFFELSFNMTDVYEFLKDVFFFVLFLKMNYKNINNFLYLHIQGEHEYIFFLHLNSKKKTNYLHLNLAWAFFSRVLV